MRVLLLLLVVAATALAETDGDELPEVEEDYKPDLLGARAAAAISSTDYKKEKDVIEDQKRLKKSNMPFPPPPYPGMPPMPPPHPYFDEEFDISNIPPLPPKIKKGVPVQPPHNYLDDQEENLSFDAAPPHLYPPSPYPHPFPYPPKCPKVCDLDLYKKCTCKAPAMYTKDGRGNCNVGASKLDLRVWCYVDDSMGHPEKVCPDALPSKSAPGHWWSRIACITG